MKNEDDFYDILGVDEDASASEIRRAYLDLSRQLHPDKYPDASPAERNAFTQAFQRMNQAYVVLRDDREAYDIERMNKKQSKATQSGVPEYHTSNTERTKPSSAKEAPSHSESSKTEKPGEQDSRFEKNEREHTSEKPQQTNEDDLYDILGVSEDASASEIVWAYCELSRKFHPDNHPHASPAERNAYTEAFWRVQQAYEVLRDYRESYDMKRMYKKYAKQSGFPEYDKTSTERNEPKTGGESSKTKKPTEKDPRSEKNESEHKSEKPQQPSYPCSGNVAREGPRFGTRADGQPCRRCQVYGKFCFQHVHQDPRFHKNEQKTGASTKQHQKAKKPSHPNSNNHAREARIFGTKADGEPCRRCQMQNKYCFQHVSQDPRHV